MAIGPQGVEYSKIYEADLEKASRCPYFRASTNVERSGRLRAFLDGPRVWIEFATQGSDHVHTIWRDWLTECYGAREFSF